MGETPEAGLDKVEMHAADGAKDLNILNKPNVAEKIDTAAQPMLDAHMPPRDGQAKPPADLEEARRTLGLLSKSNVPDTLAGSAGAGGTKVADTMAGEQRKSTK